MMRSVAAHSINPSTLKITPGRSMDGRLNFSEVAIDVVVWVDASELDWM